MKRSLLGFGFSVAALAWNVRGEATILPPNDLYLEDNLSFSANMTQQQFNDITNNIVGKYKPIAKKIHGADLTSNNLWTDSTVNANASQSGNKWNVNMYGGLARRPEVTPDGFAMVVCHELGHHFGGFPFYEGDEWAAAEGQADYFATMSCAKFIWSDEGVENAKFRATAPQLVKAKCDASYTTTEAQNLCYRTAAASQSLANLLAALGRGPSPQFQTPDRSQVSTTYTAHPAAQCRLDTYFNGSLCATAWDNNVIPGKNDPNGNDSIGAEEDAAKHSCMGKNENGVGLRPRCWFSPRL